MTRNADCAILTKLQSDAPEAARIGRHSVVKDRIIDADHRRSARSALRQVQAAGLAVGIVGEIDLDYSPLQLEDAFAAEDQRALATSA